MAENELEMERQRNDELNVRNKKLIKQIQKLKMLLADKEDEKIKVMRENNELRLKLSKLRIDAMADAKKLDAAMQSNNEQLLTCLVQASSMGTRNVELIKMFVQNQKDRDAYTMRQSNINHISTPDRVHRVPPMMLGGQSIQPVVALSRTSMSSTMNRSVTVSQPRVEHAVPMHVLQDVYIPLTRIDMPGMLDNNEEANNDQGDDSYDESELEESLEEENNQLEESMQEQGLETVHEETLTAQPVTPARPRNDPLEGPSWLLNGSTPKPTPPPRSSEPDSTTQLDVSPIIRVGAPPARDSLLDMMCAAAPAASPSAQPPHHHLDPNVPRPKRDSDSDVSLAPEFTPTVRRRRRPTPPCAPVSPAATPHHNRLSRELKVILAKIPLESCGTPEMARRVALFDAPSPNGATDAGVIVSDSSQERSDRRSRRRGSQLLERSRHSRDDEQASRRGSQESRHSSISSRRRPTSCNITLERIITVASLSTDGSDDETAVSPDIGTSKENDRSRRNHMKAEESSRDSSVEILTNRDRKHAGRRSSPTAGSSPPKRSKHATRVRTQRSDSIDSRDSGRIKKEVRESQEDSETDGEVGGRTRRPRKAVVYKEMPLNRKMRR